MEEKEKLKILILPYMKGSSEKFEWTIKAVHIRAVFQPQIIQQKVVEMKGMTSKEVEKGVIYKIPCECDAVYMCKTGHKFLHKTART